MHWFWAVLAALLLAAGVAWWVDRDSERPARQTDRHHGESVPDNGPLLYRWIDASGVMNITDTPPKGRHYTIVRIPSDRNVVPMSGTGDDAAGNATTHRPH